MVTSGKTVGICEVNGVNVKRIFYQSRMSYDDQRTSVSAQPKTPTNLHSKILPTHKPPLQNPPSLPGTLQGVFFPCCSNIVGILLFIRLPFIVGKTGLPESVALMFVCCSITGITSIALAAIATNSQIIRDDHNTQGGKSGGKHPHSVPGAFGGGVSAGLSGVSKSAQGIGSSQGLGGGGGVPGLTRGGSGDRMGSERSIGDVTTGSSEERKYLLSENLGSAFGAGEERNFSADSLIF